jgi:hypothetical protein
LISCPNGVSVKIACSVIENGPESETIPADAADISAEMMVARRAQLAESDHVMVAAVNAMQKRDAVAGMIGEPQSELALERWPGNPRESPSATRLRRTFARPGDRRQNLR